MSGPCALRILPGRAIPSRLADGLLRRSAGYQRADITILLCDTRVIGGTQQKMELEPAQLFGPLLETQGSLTETGKEWMLAMSQIQSTLLVTGTKYFEINDQYQTDKASFLFLMKLSALRVMVTGIFDSTYNLSWPLTGTYYTFTDSAATESSLDNGFITVPADAWVWLLFRPVNSSSDLQALTIAVVPQSAAAVAQFHRFVSYKGVAPAVVGCRSGDEGFVFLCGDNGTLNWPNPHHFNVSSPDGGFG